MNNIKKFRCKLGLSQAELADKLGVFRTYIGYLEGPKCFKINKVLADKIATLFDCNVFEIYGTTAFNDVPQNDADKITLIKEIAKTLDNKEIKESVLKSLCD